MDARADRQPRDDRPADSNAPSLVASLRQVYAFMAPHRRRQFYRLLALMLIGAFAEIAAIGAVVPFLSLLASQSEPQPLRWFAPVFELFGAERPDQFLVVATVLFMVAAIAAAAIRLQLAWSTYRFVSQLGHEMSVEIQRRILLQPYTFHISRNSSDILASLEKVQVLVSGVFLQLMQSATSAFLAIFIIAALVRIDAFTAAIAAAAFGLLYALVSLVTRSRLAENSKVLGSAYERRVKIIQESLGGIRDVILDHSQHAYLKVFEQIDLQFVSARANTAFIGTAPRFIIEAAGMVVIAAIALLMSDREGGLSTALPILGALALGANRLLPLMQQLYFGWTNLSGNRSIATQVLELLRLPIAPATLAAPGPPLRFEDCIRFESVSFAYPERSRPAVEGIDLTIPHGARVALMGKTGSGKSTLADLLMGLLQPTAGRITVDGVPLTEATRRAWQQSIAHVPQSIFLADASIARNIALIAWSDEIDMDRVRAAARSAQLDRYIETLPDGYSTTVGERGIRLSGGERQRLGLARAIYKQAPVLVLDEATSALDQATEKAVMHALDELGRESRTIVIIAHRRSTVEGCDLVARIENGRLAEFGSFEQVLGRARSMGAGTD